MQLPLESQRTLLYSPGPEHTSICKIGGVTFQEATRLANNAGPALTEHFRATFFEQKTK